MILAAWLPMGALVADVAVHSSDADFAAGSTDGQVYRGGAGALQLAKLAGALGSWTNIGDIPEVMDRQNGFATDDALYIVGGQATVTGTEYSRAQVWRATVAGDGSLGAWTAQTSLPEGWCSMGLARWKDRVYIGGGVLGQLDGYAVRTDVYSAPLLSDGSLGAWRAENDLPRIGVYRFFAVKGRLFGASNLDLTLVSAPIRADGSLGTWVDESAQPLPHRPIYPFAFFGGDRLWILGGETADASAARTDVITCQISDASAGAASPGAWSARTALPAGRRGDDSAGGGAGGRFYVMGNHDITLTGFPTVYSAAKTADGSLGAWATENPLPTGLANGLVLFAKGFAYYMGGMNSSVHYSDIYRSSLNLGAGNAAAGSYVNGFDLGGLRQLVSLDWDSTHTAQTRAQVRTAGTDGVFGPWTALAAGGALALTQTARYLEYRFELSDPGSGQTLELSEVRLHHAPIVAATGDVGTIHSTDAQFRQGSGDGNVDIGSGFGDGSVSLAKQAGSLGAWTTVAPLPISINAGASWTWGDTLFVAGGSGPKGNNTGIYSSDVAADGSLGAWALRGNTPYNTGVGMARWGRWLYISGGAGRNELWVAALNSDGVPADWARISDLPAADFDGRILAEKGWLYYVASRPGGFQSTLVYKAPIRPDGSIGAWTAASSRTQATGIFSPATAMGALFTVGGELSNWMGESEVDRAAVNDDGSLGSWGYATSMPAGRSYGNGSPVGHAGRLYQVGGKTYSGIDNLHNNVYSATLAAGGVPGAWGSESSLPAAHTLSVLLRARGYLYALGGSSTSTISSVVYRASLNQGTANAAQGVYVNSFDLGSNQALLQLEFTTHPLGAGSLQLRTALSGQAFGGWTAASNEGAVALTWTARHVEYRVVLGSVGTEPVKLERVVLHTQSAAPTPTPTPISPRVHQGGSDFGRGSGDGHVSVGGSVSLMKRAGSLGAWTAIGDLPNYSDMAMFWSVGDRVYAAGGFQTAAGPVSSVTDTVRVSLMDGSGQLGAWIPVGKLPAVRSSMGLARWGDRLYIAGGNDGTVQNGEIWRCVLDAQGLPGAWASCGTLPGGYTAAAPLVAAGGRLWFLQQAGNPGFDSDKTWSAPIQPDGSLGAWVAGPNRPQVMTATGIHEAAGAVYIVGGETINDGYAGSALVSRSLFAGDGSLGAWSNLAQSLPAARSYLATGEGDYAGRLWHLGGKTLATTPFTAHATAYGSTFAADGSLAAWTTEASLPYKRARGAVLGLGDRLLYIGGVYSAPTYATSVTIFAATLNQGADNAALGAYRHRFDLGSDQPVADLQLTLSAGTPGAAVKVRARTAPDAGPWSAWSALVSAPLSINASVRHVEYELVISDPGSGLTAGVDRVELSSPSTTPTPTATLEADKYKGGPFKAPEGEATAFPNPAQGGQTKFGFELEESGRCTITVWTAGGALASQVTDTFGPGKGLLKLNIKDYAPGVYLYQMVIDYDSGRKVTGPTKRFAVMP